MLSELKEQARDLMTWARRSPSDFIWVAGDWILGWVQAQKTFRLINVPAIIVVGVGTRTGLIQEKIIGNGDEAIKAIIDVLSPSKCKVRY